MLGSGHWKYFTIKQGSRSLLKMTDDQNLIEEFLRDLVSNIVEKYGNDIDFIILFGSAARGEFKKGVSDIDLVIQLKAAGRQKEIEEYATKVFWELNEKYKTEFEKVLATVKSKRILDNFLKGIEQEAHLYVPIFVFPPRWLDWEKARIIRPLWKPAAIFFIHQAFIFEKFKEEGQILYGRDIRPFIKPKITFWERWKAIQIPFWISLFSLLISPFALKQSVKYATKAILYELDSALDFVGIRPKVKGEKIKTLKKKTIVIIKKRLFDLHFKLTFSLLSPKDLEIFDKASRIKSRYLILTRRESFKFIFQVFWFIIRTNWSVFIAKYFTKKNALRLLVITIMIAIIAYFSISFYALYKLVHPKLKPLDYNPSDISQEYEDVSFRSKNGDIKISGWFFKSGSSDKVIIFVSGSDQNRIDPGYGTGNVARDLIKNGYNVLLFDFRGRGNSDYAIYSIGYFEKYDLASAFDYLVSRGYAPGKIGVISISLGSGTAILALPLISDIGGIVVDSGYSDVHTLIARELPSRSKLPNQFSWGISFWARTYYKVKFDEMVPKDILKSFSERRFLFIHGTKDKYIPIDDSVEMFRASPKSELWVVSEAGHVKAYQTNPEEYIRTVTNYFNQELQ